VAVAALDRPQIAYIAQLAVVTWSIRSGEMAGDHLILGDFFLLNGVRDCEKSADILKSWQQQAAVLCGRP